jgi:hypothetical protein
MAAGLRALADAVESTPELLSAAADSMAEEFLDARAPPADEQVRRWDLDQLKTLFRPGHECCGLDSGLHRLMMVGKSPALAHHSTPDRPELNPQLDPNPVF